MPTLPSGRRIEFSLDRFHALVERLGPDSARKIAESLVAPDDLLAVMDAVHFRLDNGEPYFAGYLAADWEIYAADWPAKDRQALQAWFASPAAMATRAEAIDYIRGRVLAGDGSCLPYPYLVQHRMPQLAMMEGSRLRQ